MSAPRGARAAALAIAAALMVGSAVGVALDRFVLLPRAFARMRSAPPAEVRDRIRERLARDLALTPEQQRRMDSLMTRQLRALDAARRTVEPRLDSLVRASRASIDSLLTPAQRATLRTLQQRNAFGFAPPPWAGPRPGDSGAMRLPPPPLGPIP